MLQRAAARAGQTMSCRVIVSSFDAALRVAAAGPGISVIPRQVSLAFTAARAVKVIPADDSRPTRRRIGMRQRYGATSNSCSGLGSRMPPASM